jgi:hypothetical protein
LNPQNYNRFGYCYNSPLKFTDPTGEFFWILPAIIGAYINFGMNLKHVNDWGDALKFLGIGAISGALGAGIGSGVSSVLAGSSFSAGLFGTSVAGTLTGASLGANILYGGIAGAAGGFTGGFLSGAGNAWIMGANFGDGLGAGLLGGAIGAGAGGIFGAIGGGLNWYSEYLIGKTQMAYYPQLDDGSYLLPAVTVNAVRYADQAAQMSNLSKSFIQMAGAQVWGSGSGGFGTGRAKHYFGSYEFNDGFGYGKEWGRWQGSFDATVKFFDYFNLLDKLQWNTPMPTTTPQVPSFEHLDTRYVTVEDLGGGRFGSAVGRNGVRYPRDTIVPRGNGDTLIIEKIYSNSQGLYRYDTQISIPYRP